MEDNRGDKMNGIVLAPIKSENTTLASARIARFLSCKFHIPLVDMNTKSKLEKKYEYVFLVNANFGFSRGGNFLPIAIDYLKTCKYPIYVNNDYVLTPPGQIMKEFRPRKWIFWSTVPTTQGINIKKTCYVNWNQLTYESEALGLKDNYLEKCIYWGAFRKKRSKYFEQFLNTNKVTISTTSRARKQFEGACPRAKIIDPFKNLYKSISKYACTLYLEDDTSGHRKYCSPANRFYEALTARVPMFFQPESVRNMKEAGFDVEPFVVNNVKELKENIETASIAWDDQQEWRKNFGKILDIQIEEALDATRKN